MAEKKRGGVPKGTRIGGRKLGTPNKATVERALIAEQELIAARENRRKLAKEYLQDILPVVASMANYFQPDVGKLKKLSRFQEAKFEKWLRLVIDVATKLAPYESPTFRAVMVAPAPETSGEKETRFTLNIFQASAPPQQQLEIIDAEVLSDGGDTQH